MKSYFIQNQHVKIFALKLDKPLASCMVCSEQSIPVKIECSFSTTKFKDIVAIINQKSDTLTEFSINQGSNEIYNSQEPRELFLEKKIAEMCETYEFDLILTD